ncbi:MAG TPA: SDR family oxidoreductase [Vicinamibacterales bacterium]|jgi:NAD(P)-dependent dehydrogenase (short-subunit alcohol dehydrogenase family)
MGQVVVVTGASSGIGRATAMRFAREGTAVLAVGRKRSALEEVARAITAEKGRCEPFVADVVTPEAPGAIIGAVEKTFGDLTALVNAAGIIASGTIENTTDEAWDQMLDINLRAPFRLMRAAVPLLTRSRGAIVNVSSVTGTRSFPGVLAYCVSKSGVDQLTRCAALELAPKGIRVNAVNPGVVVSNLHRRSGMNEESYSAFLERSKETHPLGRPGQADEIADLIVFLASDKAGWITGETVAIDGGRHLTCAR